MVHVYFADSRTLPDPSDRTGYFGLSQKEKAEVMRFSSPSARKERLGARLLLYAVLPRFGVSVSDIFYGETGKPLLNGVYFNLSHSGGMVALAVSAAPVGCDIERLRSAPVGVERRFTAAERKYLCGFTGVERDRAFFGLWTAKESYLKMTGEGLSALSYAEVDPIGGAVFRGGEKQCCTLHRCDASDYVLTVCAQESEFSLLETVPISGDIG